VDVQDLMVTVIRRIEVILISSNIYVVNLSFLDIHQEKRLQHSPTLGTRSIAVDIRSRGDDPSKICYWKRVIFVGRNRANFEGYAWATSGKDFSRWPDSSVSDPSRSV
jgi:hypothetical protein